MKTSKMLGFLTALLLMISVAGCAPAYYGGRPGGYYGRHHHPNGYGYGRPAPSRSYGGGYNRPGL